MLKIMKNLAESCRTIGYWIFDVVDCALCKCGILWWWTL